MRYKLLLFMSFFSLNICSAATTTESYFNRAALVDTGYDLCKLHSAANCENNKNLLFRGEEPLEEYTFRYDANLFREKIFSYLQKFQQVYNTNATLPKTLDELKQYRIVIVNLLYDAHDEGSDAEFGELTHEFFYSGSVATPQVPEQHKIYGLQAAFNPNQFAFEWWPVAFTEQDNPRDLTLNLNWPDNETVPVPRSNQTYKKLDLPYLITGVPYLSSSENEAMDLRSLLNFIPNDNHPLLIFYHCVAGKDRTGAVTLSYLMQYGGYANVSQQNLNITPLIRNQPLSFAEALKATTHLDYPKPRDGALVLAKAYCYNLGKPARECDF